MNQGDRRAMRRRQRASHRAGMAEMTLRQWQDQYAAGHFDSPDRQTQVDAGWHDWFCHTGELAGRLSLLALVLTGMRDGGRIDLDRHYVWFKNNDAATPSRALYGGTYDDFRISARRSGGRPTFTVSHRAPGHFEVYSVREQAIVYTGTASRLIAWFNTPARAGAHQSRLDVAP